MQNITCKLEYYIEEYNCAYFYSVALETIFDWRSEKMFSIQYLYMLVCSLYVACIKITALSFVHAGIFGTAVCLNRG